MGKIIVIMVFLFSLYLPCSGFGHVLSNEAGRCLMPPGGPDAPRSGPDLLECIAILEGASDVEELDEHIVESYLHFARNPLRINYFPTSRLVSSGLLSRYQAASVADYRQRNGDVLSIVELGSLDGFNPEIAEALRPFLSLASASLPGSTTDTLKRVSQTVMVTSSMKYTLPLQKGGGQKAEAGATDWNYSLKHSLSIGGNWDLGLALKSPYDSPRLPPQDRGWFVCRYGKRLIDKVIVGDYNLRFGQGVGMWTGFSLSGLSSVQALAKRPAGISPSRSYSGTGLRGAAIDMSTLHLSVSAFAAVPGFRKWCSSLGHKDAGKILNISVLTGANLSLLLPHGQVGATVWQRSVSRMYATGSKQGQGKMPSVIPSAGRAALDFRFTLNRGLLFFGESAYSWTTRKTASVGGLQYKVSDTFRFGIAGRWYETGYDSDYAGALRISTKTSDQYGLSIGIELFKTIVTADIARTISTREGQIRIMMQRDWKLSSSVVMKTRLTERLRDYDIRDRTDLRIDFGIASGAWTTNLRLNTLMTDAGKLFSHKETMSINKIALLAYAEEGVSISGAKGQTTAWLRLTGFRISGWDNRIYAYERDVLGSFNVPAYYGCGWAVSAVLREKLLLGSRNRLRINLRASYKSTPWNALVGVKRKPGQAGLSLQVIWDLN